MEFKKRTIAKALTWQVMGLFAMAGIGYATTGSLQAAGTVAISGFLVGSITYVLHERVWARVRWGRGDDPENG